MLEEHFYNSQIKKYITAFGNVFNNIKVKHGNGNIKSVPIKYSSKEKFIDRYFDNLHSSVTSSMPSIEKVVPVISYEMITPVYDPSRKTNTLNKNVKPIGSLYQSQLNPVPYNFTFTLSIYTRYGDELFQIIEQILPFFQPSFNITIKENEEMGIDERDVPIILNSVGWTNEYIGDKTIRRRLEADLTFTLKGWIYPDIKDHSGVIKRVLIDFGLQQTNQVRDTVEFLVDPFSSLPTDDYNIIERPGFYDPFEIDGELNPLYWITSDALHHLIVKNKKLTRVEDISSAPSVITGFAKNNLINARNAYVEFELNIPENNIAGDIIIVLRSGTGLPGYWFNIDKDGSSELTYTTQLGSPDEVNYYLAPAGTYKDSDVVRLEIFGEPTDTNSYIRIYKNNIKLLDVNQYEIGSPNFPLLNDLLNKDIVYTISIGSGDTGDADTYIGINWVRTGII